MTTHIAGYEHKDAFECFWLLWWTKKSLLELHSSPASLTLQYYPLGPYHPLLLLNTYLLLSSFPYSVLLNPITAYNLHLLLSFLLTGLTTYLLCYFLTKDKMASFIGGLVFAFSPFRTARAADGQLNQMDTYWFPLYALFLLRTIQAPSRRNGLLCGIFLAFSLLINPVHNAYFTVPFSILFFCYHGLVRSRRLWNWNRIKALTIALAVAAIAIAPFYFPFLTAHLSGSVKYLPVRAHPDFCADLLDFVIPPPTHLLVKKIALFRDLVTRVMSEPPFEERVVYAGLLPLSLAILGTWKRPSKARFWLLLGAVTGVLSLGPTPKVAEHLVEGMPMTMPYALLQRLPLYRLARTPARFDVTIMLSLGVLASLGISAFGKGQRNVLLGCAFSAVILLEYAVVFPFPAAEVQIPQFYYPVASEEGDFGILDLGTGRSHHRAMLYQTVHEHGIVVHHMYRVLPEGQFTDQLTEQLFTPGMKIIKGSGPLRILVGMKIKYVVLHKDPNYPKAWNYLPTIMEFLGKPVYEDLQIAAWEVPLTTMGIGAAPVALFGRQWHPVEMVEGRPARWMKMGGEILVKAFTTRRYRLEALVEPFHPPKNLWVLVNKEQVDEFHLDRPQRVVTQSFTLHQEGINRIGLFIPEDCEKPSELFPGNEDDRCLGALIREMELIPVSEAP